MTTRWLTVVALGCMTLGLVQMDSARYRAPFYCSLGIAFGSFIEMHRRSLHRIGELEKAIASRDPGVARKMAAAE